MLGDGVAGILVLIGDMFMWIFEIGRRKGKPTRRRKSSK